METEILLQSFKSQLRVSFFMEIIVTMCWVIWTMRNDAIFNNLAPTIQQCKMVFNKEFALVILRAKTKYHPHVVQWLEAFV
jgi:multisubunit Na+/H+ antiporter MnhE subunit